MTFYDGPFVITEYCFYDFPGFGWNNYTKKRNAEQRIIDLLIEVNLVDYDLVTSEEKIRDPQRQTIIRTVRKFLNYALNHSIQKSHH